MPRSPRGREREFISAMEARLMSRRGAIDLLRCAQDDPDERSSPEIEDSQVEFGLRRFGFFDEGFLADDDDDAGIGDVEAAAVGFEVVADFGALGEADVAINDGAANA